jgi:predicted actin-binding protein
MKTKLQTVIAAALAGAAAMALFLPGGGAAQSQAAPAAAGEPAVSGTPVQGQTLTTTNGAWTGTEPMTFEYRWLRCDSSGGGANGVDCATIPGETRNTYVLSADDVGHTIRSRVVATNADGTASANSDPTAVVRPSATAGEPQNSAPPTITGTARENQTLTANDGTWQGGQPMTFKYQWLRCDSNGGSCADISGATAKTYVLKGVDVGRTLRVRVTATNALGSSSATSTPTAVVVKASVPSGTAISVNDVVLPNRLLVDRVSFSPLILRSRRPVVARFRVSDLSNHPVQGALVYLVGIPFGNTTTPPEQATGADGYVTFVLRPTHRLKMRSTHSQPFFVRARKPGDRLIGGVSIRRLVNLRVSAR